MSTKKTAKKLSFDHYYEMEDIYENMDFSGNTVVLTDNCHLIEAINDDNRLGGKIEKAGGKVIVLFHAKSTSHFVTHYMRHVLGMSAWKFIDYAEDPMLPMIATTAVEFNNKDIIDEGDYSVIDKEIALAVSAAMLKFDREFISFGPVDNVIFEHHGYVKTCEYLALDSILSGKHFKFANTLNLFTTVNQGYSGRWSWSVDETRARLDKWSTAPEIFSAVSGSDTNWLAKTSDSKTWYRNAKRLHVVNAMSSLVGSNFNRKASDFVKEGLVKSCISFSYQPDYSSKRRMISTNFRIPIKNCGKNQLDMQSFNLFNITKQTQKDCVALQARNHIHDRISVRFGPNMEKRYFNRSDKQIKQLSLSTAFVDYLQTKGK